MNANSHRRAHSRPIYTVHNSLKTNVTSLNLFRLLKSYNIVKFNIIFCNVILLTLPIYLPVLLWDHIQFLDIINELSTESRSVIISARLPFQFPVIDLKSAFSVLGQPRCRFPGFYDIKQTDLVNCFSIGPVIGTDVMIWRTRSHNIIKYSEVESLLVKNLKVNEKY